MTTKKKLVVFCDGTWNDLRMPYRTNVSRMAQAVLPYDLEGEQQVVYYQEGVGVATKIGPLTDRATRFIGGAFGAGLDRKVEDAYRFLVLNYEPGDDIFVFGFSRGAFTARSLCGMIRKIGILKRNCFQRSSKAFDLYADRALRNDDPEAIEFRLAYAQDVASGPVDYAQYLSDARVENMLRRAAETPSRPVQAKSRGELFQYRDTEATRSIKIDRLRTGLDTASHGQPMRTYRIMYLGLWDTVASMGLPDRAGPVARLWNGRYSFYDMNTDPLVSSLRHAVSIDENRRVFSSTPVDNVEALNTVWAKRTGWDVQGSDSQLEPDRPLHANSATYIPYRYRPISSAGSPATTER